MLSPCIHIQGTCHGVDKQENHEDGILARPFKAYRAQPHSSKRGICLTKSSLFEHWYKRQPSLESAAGAGSPVRIPSTMHIVFEGSA